jgi:hypothetical protein
MLRGVLRAAAWGGESAPFSRWGTGLAVGLLLAGCGGKARSDEPEAPAAFGMQVLAEGEKAPVHLAVDERYVYWASLDSVRRAPLDGGEAVTLATAENIGGLLATRERVYYSEYAAAEDRPQWFVSSVAREGGAPERTAISGLPMALAATAEALYWAEASLDGARGRIASLAFGGSVVKEVAADLPPPSSLAADGSYIYFPSAGPGDCSAAVDPGPCLPSGIYRVPERGGAVERVNVAEAPLGVVLNERGHYWIDGSQSARVMFAPPQGVERELARVPSGFFGAEMATDASAFYWLSNHRVMQVMPDDARLTAIASGLENPQAIAVGGGWAYVAEYGRERILRIATDGAANVPHGPITGPCPAPLGNPDELALTPRADEKSERIALTLDGDRLVARQETYDRVTADMTAIRALRPDIDGIPYIGKGDNKRLRLYLDDVGMLSLQAGDYSAWDCLNDAYGVSSQVSSTDDLESIVVLELRGVYDTRRIVELYKTLPQVRYASIETDPRGNARSELCPSREGEHFEYIFDLTSGECPGRCYHEAHQFVSTAAGQVTEAAVWRSHQGEPEPAWFHYVCP